MPEGLTRIGTNVTLAGWTRLLPGTFVIWFRRGMRAKLAGFSNLGAPPMKRLLVLAYGLLCYAVFFATFLYAIGFLGNFLVGNSIDASATSSLGQALAIDVGLLALFALQHSI